MSNNVSTGDTASFVVTMIWGSPGPLWKYNISTSSVFILRHASATFMNNTLLAVHNLFCFILCFACPCFMLD